MTTGRHRRRSPERRGPPNRRAPFDIGGCRPPTPGDPVCGHITRTVRRRGTWRRKTAPARPAGRCRWPTAPPRPTTARQPGRAQRRLRLHRFPARSRPGSATPCRQPRPATRRRVHDRSRRAADRAAWHCRRPGAPCRHDRDWGLVQPPAAGSSRLRANRRRKPPTAHAPSSPGAGCVRRKPSPLRSRFAAAARFADYRAPARRFRTSGRISASPIASASSPPHSRCAGCSWRCRAGPDRSRAPSHRRRSSRKR